MKLKSIVMSAMVAIMAMAGAAYAADVTTVTGTATTGDPSYGFTPVLPAFSPADSISGSGTGFAGGMPQQVVYDGAQYQLGTADATTGYLLNQNLFGMCGAGGCPAFVPTQAAIIGNNGLAVDSLTTPANTDNFNQARFVTGLVGSVNDPGLTAFFSQKTTHYAAPDSDYIDQRLASMVTDGSGGINNFRQNVAVCGGAGCGVGTGEVGIVDPNWVITTGDAWGLTDPAAQAGQVSQGIADTMSGGNGDYGQLFENTFVVVDGGQQPAPADGPAVSYDATFIGVGPGSGTLP